MKSKSLSQNRYNLIDVIRALAIISMFVYHLCYDIFVVYGVDTDFILSTATVIWERSISFTFVIVSGVSLHFSSHAVRRGIIVNLCGVLVTVVSVIFMPSQQIWFGVLNCIGCAMLITYALRGLLGRIRSVIGMAVSILLFALTFGTPKGFIGFFSLRLVSLPEVLYRWKPLSFFGFPPKDFFSSDFFPLIPWLFLFIFGWYLWRFIKERGWDGVFRCDVPVLSVIGRYSLWIYLIHQPVLYTLCALIFGHF